MGLDMGVYCKDKSNTDEMYLGEQIKYWRKNNALHNWMVQLWYQRIGHTPETMSVDQFNCQKLELTESDILRLMADIVRNKLVPTSGFFWGALQYDEWQKAGDLEFCAYALSEIKDGKVLTYVADW